jgi:hypothetical protein
MTIATKFGNSYEQIRAASRFKTIKVNLNDVPFEFKVRIPVKRELEEIQKSITTPNDELIQRIYNDLTLPLKESIADAGEGFLAALNATEEQIRVTDNDYFVGGHSVKHVATLTAVWQTQVQCYFNLLQSATGEPITETFDEIAEEFPEAVIREIVTKIDEAIKPNYKETKKN